MASADARQPCVVMRRRRFARRHLRGQHDRHPLYPLYQRTFGVSEVTITLVYATYVIGNLGALFAFGRISDQAGRRLVSLLVLAVGGVSTLLFLFAAHPAMLFIACAASGLAIGVGAATATAWITDLHRAADKAFASRLAAAVNLIGLAVGVLVSGLLAQFAPQPLPLAGRKPQPHTFTFRAR